MCLYLSGDYQTGLPHMYYGKVTCRLVTSNVEELIVFTAG